MVTVMFPGMVKVDKLNLKYLVLFDSKLKV